MAGSKSILVEIMAKRLKPAQRKKFVGWADKVSNEDFDEGLKLFFAIDELRDAVGEYAIEQLQEIENHCDIKISAVIDVHGSMYKYRQ